MVEGDVSDTTLSSKDFESYDEYVKGPDSLASQ